MGGMMAAMGSLLGHILKLNGRLVAMTVQYPSAPRDGFQLSGGDVMVGASTLDAVGTGEQRAAEGGCGLVRHLTWATTGSTAAASKPAPSAARLGGQLAFGATTELVFEGSDRVA